jgi:hypothetical protein
LLYRGRRVPAYRRGKQVEDGQKVYGPEGQLRHWNNGVQILEGDGETAAMRSFIIGFTCGVYPVPKIFETGIYYDKFRKVNGKWYIEERNFRCDPQPEHRGRTWDPQKFADDIR